MEHNRLLAYANLLLTTGVNLQKNQTLVVSVDVENQNFANIVAEEAYRLGAAEVVFNWRCQPIGKLRLLHASEDVLSQPAPWVPAFYQTYVDKKAAFLSLISGNPEALQGVPAERISLQSRSLNKVLTFYHEAIMGSAVTWCVASVATPLWANLLGYKGTDEEKVDTLWRTIFKLCRLENVPSNELFSTHLDNLSKRTKALNELHIKSLHYSCPNGTDLTIEMPPHHLWLGGNEKAQDGTIFNANIPTEEVFSAPFASGVNGTVMSTKPLIYQGNRIINFQLTFTEGKVVNYEAEEGLEHLRELIETDEGSAYLGEVALVDHYSPISASDTIFFETLYDENASCHLALGAAYPTCLEGGEELGIEELKKHGLNHSLTHVDFMIGHADMNIEATTQSGNRICIMEKGRLLV